MSKESLLAKKTKLESELKKVTEQYNKEVEKELSLVTNEDIKEWLCRGDTEVHEVELNGWTTSSDLRGCVWKQPNKRVAIIAAIRKERTIEGK